jgi:hypothetical protein
MTSPPKYYKDCPCPVCDGLLFIRNSKPLKREPDKIARYFRCRKCSWRGGDKVPTKKS